MSARLQELLHQKALLAEHTAWLEREIASERARIAPPQESIVPPATIDAPPLLLPTEPTAPSAESPIALTGTPDVMASGSETGIDQYRPEPKAIQSEVTRGCLLYFLAGLALFAVFVVTVYLVYRRR